MSRAPVGVLLMAYGTPATPQHLEEYYTHIRRGRRPTPELLAELQGRYEAIGGISPLLERTQAQASGLQAALGQDFSVELGMKHAPPFIEDAVMRLRSRGVRQAVGLVLAPHFSRLSVGEYATRAVAAATSEGIALEMIQSWHLEPGYVRLLAEFVTESVAAVGVSPVDVVFTAHSLPMRILREGDPYPAQLREMASAVAHVAGLDQWSVGWQSAGRTAESWIGPDILDVLRARAADGTPGVAFAPPASCPITSRCCTTSTWRPETWRQSFGSPSPAPACRTTILLLARRWPM